MGLIGSQPFDRETAFKIGLGCPKGREVELLFGLIDFWPNIHSMPEIKKALLDGLAKRYEEKMLWD